MEVSRPQPIRVALVTFAGPCGLFPNLPISSALLGHRPHPASDRLLLPSLAGCQLSRNYLLRKGFHLPGRNGLGVFVAKLLPN